MYLVTKLSYVTKLPDLTVLTYLELFGKLLFFYLINIRIFENNTKNVPVWALLYSLTFEDSSSWKVDFSASSKCLRIRALDRLCTNLSHQWNLALSVVIWF